jgi:hypothetical protein
MNSQAGISPSQRWNNFSLAHRMGEVKS